MSCALQNHRSDATTCNVRTAACTYKQNHKKTMFHAYSIAKTALSKMKSTLMDAIFSDENLL